MTALLVVIATLVVIYFAFRPKRNSQSSGAASPRYSCMRCDMPYAIPDVPMRCRSCGGMVEKL